MKDAYWFPHDADANSDLKIEAMILRYGMAGYGMFWIVIETLRSSDGYKLPQRDYIWAALAKKMMSTPEQAEDFVTNCINEFDLLDEEDGMFFSPSLLRRMESWEDRKKMLSESGRRGGLAKAAKDKENRSQAMASPEKDVAGHSEATAKSTYDIILHDSIGHDITGEAKAPPDELIQTYGDLISAKLPRTSWPDVHGQHKALFEMAKMTRETYNSTPIRSPFEFARLVVETFARLKRTGKSDFWKNVSFEPKSVHRRFGDCVTEMAKLYNQHQEDQKGLELLEKMRRARKGG